MIGLEGGRRLYGSALLCSFLSASMSLTDWQRVTRNKIIRLIREMERRFGPLGKRADKTLEIPEIAAIALSSADVLEKTAQQLREYAADLGYTKEEKQ